MRPVRMRKANQMANLMHRHRQETKLFRPQCENLPSSSGRRFPLGQLRLQHPLFLAVKGDTLACQCLGKNTSWTVVNMFPLACAKAVANAELDPHSLCATPYGGYLRRKYKT